MSIGGGRAELKRYAQVVGLWLARYDTQEIAEMTDLPEHIVARWVVNFREQARSAA